jgi:hypothetical protein
MKKSILILLPLLLFATLLFAGGKEKKNKVKSRTEYTTLYEKGKEITYKESYEEFNKEGKTVLKIEYKPDGTILTKESVKFDAYGNVVEEIKIDNEKNKYSKTTFKYNADNEKSEEVEYDKNGIVLKKTVLNYNGEGNRTAEVVFDKDGNVLKKHIYSFNQKKMRTEKKTYNAQDILESLKKFEFSYY